MNIGRKISPLNSGFNQIQDMEGRRKMEQANVLDKKDYKDGDVSKVTYLKTEQMAQDTYYFKPGQVLAYHRHPNGDQAIRCSLCMRARALFHSTTARKARPNSSRA